MNYAETERELLAIPKFGATASLENLSGYLALLGHPEEALPVIHVAGTNGKGSVCAFLESILRRAGCRTALFTSPHLVEVRERFRIDGELCPRGTVVKAWEEVRTLMERETKAGRLAPLTFFEVLFLMAVRIFREAGVDYCILETGLGGRKDATALTHPLLSVLTSISLDHTELLGDTIEQIAWEKAGIIKKGVPVVAFDEKNGAYEVFCNEAEIKSSHIYKVSYEDVTFLKKCENKIDFSLNSRYYRCNRMEVNSRADYQMYNASLAAVAVKVLLPALPDETVREGIAAMRWEGRMECVAPGVYVDGAHNVGAVEQICRMLQREAAQALEKQPAWILVFAACADKDYEEMIRRLCACAWKRIYVTSIREARGADLSRIYACFARFADCPVTAVKGAGNALAQARREREEDRHIYEKDDKILCLGSLYLVGEIKAGLESEDKHDRF